MIPNRIQVLSLDLDLAAPRRGEHMWEVRSRVATELIQLRKPGLLLTQEGNKDTLEALAAGLPDYYLVQEQREWIAGIQYPTIWFRKDMFEFEDAKDVWLSETPRVRGSSSWGASAPQILTLAQLNRKDVSGGLLVGSTQLDAQVDRARLEAAAVLVSQVAKFNGDELPVILAGSFHERPDETVYRLLTGRRTHKGLTGSFRDAHRLARRSEAGMSTWHGYVNRDGGRMDWILVEGALEAQESYVLGPGTAGQGVSDHYPVAAEFLL